MLATTNHAPTDTAHAKGVRQNVRENQSGRRGRWQGVVTPI